MQAKPPMLSVNSRDVFSNTRYVSVSHTTQNWVRHPSNSSVTLLTTTGRYSSNNNRTVISNEGARAVQQVWGSIGGQWDRQRHGYTRMDEGENRMLRQIRAGASYKEWTAGDIMM